MTLVRPVVYKTAALPAELHRRSTLRMLPAPRSRVRARSVTGRSTRAFTRHLVESDPRGDAGVQRFGSGCDGDPHQQVAALRRQPGQAPSLRPDDNHQRPVRELKLGDVCVAAFGAHGVVSPARRSAGVTAPAEDFHADAVTPAERRAGMTTPCAPKA